MRRRLLSTLAIAVVLHGCSTEDGPEDTGGADIGFADGTVADTGSSDTGPVDTGPSDAGADAGMDAGPTDAGERPLPPVDVDVSNPAAPRALSEFNFFRYRGDGVFEYNDGVIPYELNSALFTDFALKARAIYVPTSTAAEYSDVDVLEFPVGSAIIKSFLLPADLRVPDEDVELIETRVMIRYADGWKTFPYVWNEDGTDAEYWTRGLVETKSFIDDKGNPRTTQYLVPQANQCIVCHELKDEAGERHITIIGPKARHLNRDNVYDGQTKNQLEHLAEVGALVGLPDINAVERAYDFDDFEPTSTTTMDYAELNKAARDYLDINCAHCHNPNHTQGQTSRLFLNYDNTNEFNLGVCKEPGSAGSGSGGLKYDIWPGEPDLSILYFRTATEEPGKMMPLIGRSLAHDDAVELLRAWIARMPGDPCE